jgi:hypothetical protein
VWAVLLLCVGAVVWERTEAGGGVYISARAGDRVRSVGRADGPPRGRRRRGGRAGDRDPPTGTNAAPGLVGSRGRGLAGGKPGVVY